MTGRIDPGARPRRRVALALAAAALALLGGCGPKGGSSAAETTTPATGALTVAAVNYPLVYFAERIGGDAVEVLFLVPRGVDPAFWEPSPAEVVRIQSAELILLNGAGYAAWTRTATLPLSRAVDTSRAFSERLIVLDELTTHSHGPEGPHEHGATAFTTWIDPELAILQAAAVRDALAVARPGAADAFNTAFSSLETELLAQDTRLAAAVARSPELPVIFSHPVYSYLERAYGIRGMSLHWEPDVLPTDEQWQELDRLRVEHAAHWMVWESEPLAATIEGLRARGLESAVFDPSGNRPAHGDLLSRLAAGAEALERVFGSQ